MSVFLSTSGKCEAPQHTAMRMLPCRSNGEKWPLNDRTTVKKKQKSIIIITTLTTIIRGKMTRHERNETKILNQMNTNTTSKQ